MRKSIKIFFIIAFFAKKFYRTHRSFERQFLSKTQNQRRFFFHIWTQPNQTGAISGEWSRSPIQFGVQANNFTFIGFLPKC